jgi:uncharacterized protein HemY
LNAGGRRITRLAFPLSILGRVHAGQGRWLDAESHLRRALGLQELTFDVGHVELRETFEALSADHRSATISCRGKGFRS